MMDELDTEEHRQSTIRDYWFVIVRRRWYLMGPFFLCGLGGIVIAWTWPLQYRSEALILVEEQKVPEQYVIPDITTSLQARLNTMMEQILSHTRLQRLIEAFTLYAKERSRMPIEDVIDTMRQHISVEPVATATQNRSGDLTGFKIYYSSENPRLAQRVANELTSLFIEENLRARTQQSANMTAFLENQLGSAKADLENQERQLREYKLHYLGELPEEQRSNLQILSSLDGQLRASSDALDRAEQQKLYLESMRSEYQAFDKSLVEAKESVDKEPYRQHVANPVEITLEQLGKQLAELKTKYTGEHPDVRAVEHEIAHWEAIRSHSGSENEEKEGASNVAHTRSNESMLIEVESRLKAAVSEIDSRKNEVNEMHDRIKTLQMHLSVTPVREQQLAEVTRMYENARTNYESLLQKKLQSQLASNLEKRQQGEVFRVLDPASLPTRPDGRLEIVLWSWLAGMCIGLLTAAIGEFGDNTIRSAKQLRACAPFPVVLRLPVLLPPGIQCVERWRIRLEIAAASLLTLVSIGGSLQLYFA